MGGARVGRCLVMLVTFSEGRQVAEAPAAAAAAIISTCVLFLSIYYLVDDGGAHTVSLVLWQHCERYA